MTLKRKLNRLSGYDYSSAGAYFVTIKAHGNEPVFGEIQDNKIQLNRWGLIVEQQWKWLFQQYKYIEPGEYIVMLDHFHGILFIDPIGVGNGRDRSVHDRSVHDRSVHDRSVKQDVKIKPLPELIGAFKTTSSKLIHRNGHEQFKWQKSYHDRIIRDEYELNRIREYIINNPAKWVIENDMGNSTTK